MATYGAGTYVALAPWTAQKLFTCSGVLWVPRGPASPVGLYSKAGSIASPRARAVAHASGFP